MKQSASNNMINQGKLQPQAIDLEEVVLGAIMLEKNALTDVSDILSPEVFYKEAHSIIYQSILNLYKMSLPIDILTVTEELKRMGKLDLVGGRYYIAHLTGRVASSANIVSHGAIILQKFMQRELIRISTENIKQAYEDSADSFDLLDKNYTALNSLANRIIRTPAKGSAALFSNYIKKLETILKSTGDITGVPTRLTQLNKIMGGLQDSDLIIIAGRPGMGKTAITKAIINGGIDSLQKPILLFSIEMSADQIINRFIAEDVNVNSQFFNSKKFIEKTDFNKINTAINRYSDNNGKDLLIIDDTASLSINELRTRAKRVHAEHGLSCIVIDYLQKISSTNSNKTYEIEEICAGLKALAKELNIPVVALSQLSRECEKRSPPIPQLSDLRSSGSIEQDADVVIFLYRPEYYGIEELDEGGSTYQYAQAIIAKHRNGSLGKVEMRFTDHLTKFEDWGDIIDQVVISNGNNYNPSAGLSPNQDFHNDNPF